MDLVETSCVTQPLVAYIARAHQLFFAYKSWTDGRILMILTYIIDIDETLNLTQGQGHKSKVKVILAFMWKNSFDYNSWTYSWILMKLLVMVNLSVIVLHQIYFVQDQTHTLWKARVGLIFTRRKCPCFLTSSALVF